MKDAFDKDPFAEYDKYWDNLDKTEEKVDRTKNKNYGFSDIEKPSGSRTNSNKHGISIVAGVLLVGIMFSVVVNVTSAPWMGFMMMPIIQFIVVAVIIAVIAKNRKNN